MEIAIDDDVSDDIFFSFNENENFTLNEDNGISNSTDIWANGVYGSKVHLIRGISSLIAIIPNLFFIIVFLSKRKIWGTINWLIVQLIFCNCMLCTIYAIYSYIKFADSFAPVDKSTCLTLIWFTIMMSCSPTWGIACLLFTRAAMNVSSKKVQENTFSVFRLVIFLVAFFCLNAIFVSLIIREIAPLTAISHCSYYLMLANSKMFILYGAILFLCVIVAGAATLLTRLMLRRKIMKRLSQQKLTEQSNISIVKLPVESNQEPVKIQIPSSVLPIKPPAALWMQPKFVILFILMAALFLLPRGAFLLWKVKNFWLITSFFPLIIAFIFPILFLTLRKSLRMAVHEIFYCRMKKDGKISPAGKTFSAAQQQIFVNSTTSNEAFREVA